MYARDELVLECWFCAGPQPIEVPSCADGHDDCPDRACAGCGAALFLDPILPRERRLVRSRRSARAA